ncbi:MAG: hypothetical protein JRI51_06095 [Deltaproteobacteria bacterium]|nr:hypothetical protein [Deltaproteobacteria bacterium]
MAQEPNPSHLGARHISIISSWMDKITEVYLNDGTPISGSSVAAYFRGKLLIGSVFDPKFLVCSTLE